MVAANPTFILPEKGRTMQRQKKSLRLSSQWLPLDVGRNGSYKWWNDRLERKVELRWGLYAEMGQSSKKLTDLLTTLR
jgi:hypothetical protein